MKSPAKILILTLYSGENEFKACQQSIENQTYTNYEWMVIQDKPNLEAHHELYRTVMSKKDEFDLFLKLDADMTFMKPDSLQIILNIWGEQDHTDHMIIPVQDYMPNTATYGAHLYSNRVTWNFDKDNLFVDPNPKCAGLKRDLPMDMPPLIAHANNPTPYHAFHYGLHRGMKTFQKNRFFVHPQARAMWPLLTKTWDHFITSRDHNLGLAIMGADAVRTGLFSEKDGTDKNNPKAIAHFESIKNMSTDEIFQYLQGFWASPTRGLRWWMTCGWRSYFLSINSRFKKLLGL